MIGPFGSRLKKEFLVYIGYKLYEQENIYQNDFCFANKRVTYPFTTKLISIFENVF